MGDDLTPEEALRQIGEVDRRPRRPARVAGLLYALLGLGTIAYWPIMYLGPGWSRATAGVAWIVLTFVFAWHLGRMRVQDREVTWVNKFTGPVTVTYFVAFLAVFVFGTFFRPDDPDGGWIATLVTLAACASIPPFYAAWRVLRAER
ncbi:hypothetical protein OG884_24450 [Streptosporangium sp. NBC_01755]|uniref:hypothetical protein n=1 Tax=unclassified Streptosporangium TaxID=2632669 RepID=UPI002DDB9935|nr:MULTISPECIES: hypothetical protein [unclassified Streptosporangium]WSA23897.1 hypothetical protein OIE13_23460 [Streptosporangium sp. NBC_01810]WSC98028.1 hypothetical protein OG884_24450 [Streptosporangium sp. NBC_01755]